jgi:predicted GIY-YIG superfamily endonuclease
MLRLIGYNGTMHYVYILRSEKSTDRFYIGYTENLDRRLFEHLNAPSDAYTRRYAPWKLETYVVFKDKKLAVEFEAYLKSHSGRAFLRRRLMAAE